MMQQGRPTVGDTITIVHRVAARPGAVIDARPPADSALATLVAPPVLTREGDSVQIAYTFAVWSAGHNDLVLPGAIVVDQHGHVDTLADVHVPLDVASVLPATKATGQIAPQSARTWLSRSDRTGLPFAVIVPLVLLLIGALQWRWRRRGPTMSEPASTRVPIPLTDARINGWLAAGEPRLVLEHLDVLARDRPEFTEWRARVAAARFAPGDDAIAVGLAQEAWARLRPSN